MYMPNSRYIFNSEICLCRPAFSGTSNTVQLDAPDNKKAAQSPADVVDQCSPKHATLYQESGHIGPGFANLRIQKQLDRFSLRTKSKVNVQWKLFALVNNNSKTTIMGWHNG
jgi:hypothetical protein